MSSHHDSRSFAELLNTSVSEHLSADDSFSPASSRRSDRLAAGQTPESTRPTEGLRECPPTEDISRLSAGASFNITISLKHDMLVLSHHSMQTGRPQVGRRMSRATRGGDLSSLTQATDDLVDDCIPRNNNIKGHSAPLQLIMYAIKLFRRGVISKDQATLVQDFCLDSTSNREQCDTMRATLEISSDEEDRQLAMEMWVTNLEKADARRAMINKEYSERRQLPELSPAHLGSVISSSGQSTRAPSPYCPSPAASSPANSAIYNHMAAGALQQQALHWQQQQQQQHNGSFHPGQQFGPYFPSGSMQTSYQPMQCASPAPASPQSFFAGSHGGVLQQMEGASVVNMSLASPNAGSQTTMADMSGIAGCQLQQAPELRRPQPSRLNPRAQSESGGQNEDVPLELMPMGTPPLPHSRSPSPTLPTPPGQSSIVHPTEATRNASTRDDDSHAVTLKHRDMYETYKDPLDIAGAEALASKGTYCKPWQYVGNELGSVCYGLAWTDGLESSICYHSGTTQACRGLPVSCTCTPPTTEEATPVPTTATSTTPTAPVTTVPPSTTIPLRI
ncbi:Trehalose-6-P synthase/phosphatase complex synthase subunit [Perkinsus chesapeaki]|uniref:Trehalose-6-P synthase/phosphatase complex synthase subunit n=1 Tax=Perkinsus chesapeaki TaxID=330153 RepID=A0A7J6LBW0_PERCH|nr:Trehalose-6-P synthase/phosphatase complex synthase subunit [Perkinsus chesapeaki]